ncbi:MAG: alpha/beta hydrolase [Rhodospirillales bacterium]|nr:alpha/beta hydrolase [Rhodospirillales bacterium]
MAALTAADGVKLAYIEAGRGVPIVFVHEFAGDMRCWEPQLRFFARRYRSIAFNARGYPPSDVPPDPAAYSQDRATDDIAAVLRGLGIARAHIVGLSMGGFATLHFGLRYPHMAVSLVAAGVGYGASPTGGAAKARENFHAEVDATIAAIRAEGMAKRALAYSRGPTRLQFEAKDPRGFAEFQAALAEHSTEGSALTMQGVQRARPNLYDLAENFRALRVPTLIVCGDEDEPTLEPSLFLKRTIPTAGLVMFPRTGHAMNLEEPALFNRAVLDFLTLVASGRWTARDPATQTGAILSAAPAERAPAEQA